MTDRFSLLPRPCLARVACIWMAALFVFLVSDMGASIANAQWRSLARRGIAVPVPVPVAPSRYYVRPTVPAPVGPPVRIRTPFFSLSINSGYSSPVYGYSYRPSSSYYYRSYRYGAPSTSYGYGSSAYRRDTVPRVNARIAPGANLQRLYQPGLSGGVPDLTPSAPIPSLPTQPMPLQPREMTTPSYEPPPSGLSLSRLEFSAQTLLSVFERRGEEGQVWVDFLAPAEIASLAREGVFTARVGELKSRYEGVTMNPDLKWITREPGFQGTYQQLNNWVTQGIGDAVAGAPSASTPPFEPSPAAMIEPSSKSPSEPSPLPAEDNKSETNEGTFELLPSPAEPKAAERSEQDDDAFSKPEALDI